MSEIVIQRRHGMPRKKARAAAERIAAELAEEFGIDYGWEGDCLAFSRPGTSGSITVGKTHVEVRARLGLMLVFLRSRIESEIQRFCDENFGAET